MGGTADGGHMVTQAVPDDLVTVREAAQVVGVSPQTVYGWIVSGRLMASGPRRGRRVSLAALRALCAPLDPQTPPEALLVYDVARAVGLPKGRIRIWAVRGLLPNWQSHHGLLVRAEDVRALAQKQGALPPDAETGE